MDERIWFYLIAAVIYFLVKRKKKQPVEEVDTPTAANRPEQQRKAVSFEDLLREITEERQQGARPVVVEDMYQEEEDLPLRKMREEAESQKNEGRNRHFADDESRKVYEESIKQAEGADINFEPDEHYASESLFKGNKKKLEPALADEIREGLQNTATARKAIIYGEILNRRY